MRIIKDVLILLFSIVTIFVPKKEGLWIFGAWYGFKFNDNPKYLFLHCLQLNNLKVVWLTGNRNLYEKYKTKYPIYMKFSFRGLYYASRAEIAFVSNLMLDGGLLSLRTKIVNLWHGVPVKKIVYDDQINKMKPNERFYRLLFDRNTTYIATSEFYKQIYFSAFNTKNVLTLGQPRTDILINDRLLDDLQPEIEKLFSVFKKGDKFILTYLPTHRSEGAVNMTMIHGLNFQYLDDILEQQNAILLIKKHFCHNQEVENLNNAKNIYDLTALDIDTQVLLKYTDVLVTDYSSVFVDFLITDKPIIFYCFDFSNYLEKERDLYFDLLKLDIGKKAYSFNEFMLLMNKAIDSLRSDQTFATNNDKYLFYNNDCKYACDSIINYFSRNN